MSTFLDLTFSGAAGTALSAYTESGVTFASVVSPNSGGTAVITPSGTVRPEAGTALYLVSTAPPSADYSATITVAVRTLVQSDQVGVGVRMTGDDHGYLLVAIIGGDIYLVRRDAGV